jgi:4-hydroxy-tetrahydrodipicolinate synthase
MTHLRGIVPPLPTPLSATRAELDLDALTDLVNLHLTAGVHGLWVLGTTARFDLLPDDWQRAVAERVAAQVGGSIPLVLNVSDQGTLRTLARARLFRDLPYDYYAALPPWYQPLTRAEIRDYFVALADQLDKPLYIYNAPWICNQLTFEELRELAEHPRIVGCKDVTPALGRPLAWKEDERRDLDFCYLHGSDLIGLSTELGADGFVSALSDVVPALAVALWNAAERGDHATTGQLQAQFSRLGRALEFGPFLACLDAAGRALRLFASMLPPPLQPLDLAAEARVTAVFHKTGTEPAEAPRASTHTAPQPTHA